MSETIKFGNLDIDKLYFGGSEVIAAYMGETKVYPAYPLVQLAGKTYEFYPEITSVGDDYDVSDKTWDVNFETLSKVSYTSMHWESEDSNQCLYYNDSKVYDPQGNRWMGPENSWDQSDNRIITFAEDTPDISSRNEWYLWLIANADLKEEPIVGLL